MGNHGSGCDSLTTFDGRSFHGDGSMHTMQLEIESTGVTDRLTRFIASPQRGSGGLAIGTYETIRCDFLLDGGGGG